MCDDTCNDTRSSAMGTFSTVTVPFVNWSLGNVTTCTTLLDESIQFSNDIFKGPSVWHKLVAWKCHYVNHYTSWSSIQFGNDIFTGPRVWHYSGPFLFVISVYILSYMYSQSLYDVLYVPYVLYVTLCKLASWTFHVLLCSILEKYFRW
jgi:hypothetical protein